MRLPFPPGVEYDYMAEPPAEGLPLKWDKGFKVENDVLTKAKFVLADEIVGASKTVSHDCCCANTWQCPR